MPIDLKRLTAEETYQLMVQCWEELTEEQQIEFLSSRKKFIYDTFGIEEE